MTNLNAKFLLASHLGKVEYMRTLVLEGCDVNCRSLNGNNALHLAASEGNALVIPVLIELGIDTSSDVEYNGSRWNALHIAVAHKQAKLIPILANFIDVNSIIYPCVFGSPNNALILAAQTGCIDTVSALIDLGIDVNAMNTKFHGPLHIASACNYTDMIPILVHAGVNINSYAGSPFGLRVNSLHIAAHYGHINDARILIEMGIDIEAKDNSGYNAIHHAAESQNPDMIVCLLELGCEQDLKNFHNQRPLDLAQSSETAIEVLVNSGCELDSQDLQSESVQHAFHRIQVKRNIVATALREVNFEVACSQEVLRFLFRQEVLRFLFRDPPNLSTLRK